MALKSVTKFLTDLKFSGGPSSTNQYDLQFVIDSATDNNELSKWLESYGVKNNSFNKLMVDMANEIQIPGVSMVSQDVKGIHKGINMKPAMAKVFNEMDMSFILDVQSEAYKFFRGWQDFITGNPANIDFVSQGRVYDRAYVQHYYKSYVCDTIIKKFEKYDPQAAGALNVTNTPSEQYHVWTVKLINSYPYMVSSIPYSSGGSGVVKLSVGMYYEYSELLDAGSKNISVEA